MWISVKQQYIWRLEQKGSFRLIGKSIRVSRRNGKHYTKILDGDYRQDRSYGHLKMAA